MIGEIKHDEADWHGRFMHLALHVAGWSKDPKRKVGAVIVDEQRRVVAMGYNGFPRGLADMKQRMGDADEKRMLTVHAELNAILNATAGTRGCMMYVTSWPCHECAKAIVQAGIPIVVSPKPDFKHPTWGKSNKVAWDMMNECGVSFVHVDMVQEGAA